MSAGARWILVAETPFHLARAGGEVEQLGIALACRDSNRLAAIVIPVDEEGSETGFEDQDRRMMDEQFPGIPVIETPRRRSVVSALNPTRPYVTNSRPVSAEMLERIAQAAPDATGVVALSYKSYLLSRRISTRLRLPLVVRPHNLEGPYHHSLANGKRFPASLGVHLEAARVDVDERLGLERDRKTAAILDISETDAAVRGNRSRVPVVYAPTFAALTKAEVAARTLPESGADETAVFVGSLDVSTNYDAVSWFATKVWPLVLQARPEAEFHVVGRKPTAQIRELVERTPRTKLFADVPDPAEYLAHAGVAVNPTVSGSGLNVKLIDYLSAGIPVVSTGRGVQSLGLTDGQGVGVGDTPKEFADAVTKILADREFAASLSAAGLASVAELRDPERGLLLIEEAMNRTR